MNWPPAYKIKTHALARNVKLHFHPEHGLKIIVPTHFSHKEIPDILTTHKDWILKQFAHVPVTPLKMPSELCLPALNRCWHVRYVQCDAKFALIHLPNDELVFTGKISDSICQKALKSFVRQQAKLFLPDLLNSISRDVDLSYSKLTIREQSTRWGSCNYNKSINLNYKLIFLPLPLVKHVMIHELCHTKVLNHSKKFWQLLATLDPNWQEHNKSLKKTHTFMPDWLLANP